MPIHLKKFLFNFSFNISLFLILFVGIQNSNQRSTVNLLKNESVNLPVSFIIGVSFISGSILGSFIKINIKKNSYLS